MKSFLIIYGILFLIACVGCVTQNGEANAVTYSCVAPLILFGSYHLFSAFKK
jgi:hypothetical protein